MIATSAINGPWYGMATIKKILSSKNISSLAHFYPENHTHA